jgi:hypothetical protein
VKITHAATARVRTVAERSVIASGAVGNVRARAGPITDVVRAGVAVVRAQSTERHETVLRHLVAQVVAIESKKAGIAGVDTTASSAARVRTVAEDPIVAGDGIVGMQASTACVATLGRTRVAVVRAGAACGLDRADPGATIAGVVVAVIALLARIENPVSANHSARPKSAFVEARRVFECTFRVG